MLREGTAVVQLWFSLLVMYGVYCLKGGPADWAGYVHFLQNPVVVLVNILTLAGTLLHTVTGSSWHRKPSILLSKTKNGTGADCPSALGGDPHC